MRFIIYWLTIFFLCNVAAAMYHPKVQELRIKGYIPAVCNVTYQIVGPGEVDFTVYQNQKDGSWLTFKSSNALRIDGMPQGIVYTRKFSGTTPRVFRVSTEYGADVSLECKL